MQAGEAAPGTVIRLAYGGRIHEIVTSGRGWWFFVSDFVDWNHPDWQSADSVGDSAGQIP